MKFNNWERKGNFNIKNNNIRVRSLGSCGGCVIVKPSLLYEPVAMRKDSQTLITTVQYYISVSTSHTKTIGTQTSVPTSMINISCITCFVIVVK